MPQTSENPCKMKKTSRVIWSYFGFKVLNPEVQLIASRSITTPPFDQGCNTGIVPSVFRLSIFRVSQILHPTFILLKPLKSKHWRRDELGPV